MKKKTALLLLIGLTLSVLSSCNISNPLVIGVGPVSGSRPVSLGVEGTLVGRTVGIGVWVEGDH